MVANNTASCPSKRTPHIPAWDPAGGELSGCRALTSPFMQEEAFWVHPSKALLSPSSLIPPQQRLSPGYHYNIKWPLGGPPSPQRLEEGACLERFRPLLASCLGPEAKTHLIGAPRGEESSRVPSTRHPRLG